MRIAPLQNAKCFLGLKAGDPVSRVWGVLVGVQENIPATWVGSLGQKAIYGLEVHEAGCRSILMKLSLVRFSRGRQIIGHPGPIVLGR